MSVADEDWSVLLSLFPAEWEELGRKTRAVTRLRGFNSVSDVLRTLLMHVGTGWSLRETAVRAKLAGIAAVSDVTLLNRLRQSEGWLRELCQQLWKENGLDLTPAIAGYPVRLVDGSVVKEPGKTGSQWRLHYSLRLPSLECDEFILTAAHGQGNGDRLGRFHFRTGELILADAGYSNPPGVAAVLQKGAQICMRLNPHTLPLFDRKGRPLDLLALVRSLSRPMHSAEWPAWVHYGNDRFAGRVCVIRKTEEASARAQRMIELKVKRGKGTLSPERQEYARFVIVFTTLSDDAAQTDQVLEGYRMRWQIELTFKRLKSIVQLGHVPKLDDQSSRSWLLGKLFVALLSQKLARVGRAISPWGYVYVPKAPTTQPLA
ncbi:MAG: IS4 family transposase [Pyrinomonadaceae bacterium]|nr:IS4 family transposase [Pyrinomonadaceae bacterium]